MLSPDLCLFQCGRNALVLQQTHTLTERAASIENNNADFVNELGSQLLLAGKTREAMKCFRTGMKLDETSVQALTGIIRCQLLDGQIDEAAQQLEFLNEIQQSLGRSAVSSLLWFGSVLFCLDFFLVLLCFVLVLSFNFLLLFFCSFLCFALFWFCSVLCFGSVLLYFVLGFFVFVLS